MKSKKKPTNSPGKELFVVVQCTDGYDAVYFIHSIHDTLADAEKALVGIKSYYGDDCYFDGDSLVVDSDNWCKILPFKLNELPICLQG